VVAEGYVRRSPASADGGGMVPSGHGRRGRGWAESGRMRRGWQGGCEDEGTCGAEGVQG
jgi:hypothetical protein